MNILLLLCINWLQIYPEGFLLVSKGVPVETTETLLDLDLLLYFVS